MRTKEKLFQKSHRLKFNFLSSSNFIKINLTQRREEFFNTKTLVAQS